MKRPRTKVHLLARTNASGMFVGLCGWTFGDAGATSSVIAEVTCKLCLRKHSPPKRASRCIPSGPSAGQTEAHWRELTRRPRETETTEWDGVVTPAIWASTCLRRGTDDECGTCIACARAKDLRRWAALDGVYERDPIARTPVDHRYRYRRAEQAIDGGRTRPSDSKSTAGSFEELLKHGCRIDGGPARDQSQAIHRWVEDWVDYKRCTVGLFDERNDRGLGPATCWLILDARVIGRDELVRDRAGRQHRITRPVPAEELAREYGVTVAMVGAIVKSGMRRLRVELAARELIPPPPRSSGLADEIDRRRRELLNERAMAEREGRRVA